MQYNIYILIINAIITLKYVKVKKILNINTKGDRMKIYDFNGNKNICGKRVQEARKKMKLSQKDLAAKLQVEGVIIERDSVSRMELGTRFVADYEIAVLCKILNVTPGYLLGIEE